MGTLLQDIKYAYRQMRKNPGFTVIALITLAIGIGANTVMFSLVDMLILQSAKVNHPEQLAVCQAENANWHFPYEAYLEFRDNNPVFTDVAAVGGYQDAATWALEWQQVHAKTFTYKYVSANYFSLLGAVPYQGRWFLPEEERYGAEPVVVLSYNAWKRCGGDPKLVDKPIWLNGKPVRVIGVAAKGFTGTSLTGPEIWLPLGSGVTSVSAGDASDVQAVRYPRVIPLGRLRPNVEFKAAQSQLQALVPGLRENYPNWWEKQGRLTLSRPGRMYLVTAKGPESERRSFWLLGICLMSVSGIVLLIACLNLAGMLTVQGTTRQREIAIRMAVGGSRLHIIRQLISEYLLMSLAGGALGCLLAMVCIRSLNVWIAALWLSHGAVIPTGLIAKLDGRVLLGTLGFCVLATILFGLKPAWRLAQRDVMADLKESARDALRSTRKRSGAPRCSYLIAQTALAVVLVMGAGLFTRSAMQVGNIMADFDFDGKLYIALNLQNPQGNSSDRQACRELVKRLEALPGVESVATSRTCTFKFGWPTGPVYEYRPGDENAEHRSQITTSSIQYNVGLNYFKTMGIRLLRGRSFRDLDCVAGAEKVIIIDEELAHKLRPNGDALGCLIQFGPGKHYEKVVPHRVIGIVNTLYTAMEKKRGFKAQMYVPTSERAVPIQIHVLGRNRTSKHQEALMQTVSQMIHSMDSPINTSTIETLKEHYQGDEFVWMNGMSARLALTFGAMALFLAALGMYATKMYMVASRTPEIGIRMALGATAGDIVFMVLREGGILMLAGLGLGLILGLTLANLAQSIFYNVSPVDSISIGSTIVILTVVSLVAAWIPARRAAKIDPMEALRYE
jgi:predicted permease